MRSAHSKIRTWETAKRDILHWQDQYLRVVFTNGCFDILHLGHVQFLEAAKTTGDRLIVAVNTDVSVRLLKGLKRPINPEEARMHLLAALECVDLVVKFEQETPLELIQYLLPNVLVKGGDYTVHEIVGAEEVLKQGGIVKSLPFIDGYSTSAIEEKILKSHTH